MFQNSITEGGICFKIAYGIQRIDFVSRNPDNTGKQVENASDENLMVIKGQSGWQRFGLLIIRHM